MASSRLIEILQEGYEYLQGFCPQCLKWRTMPFDRLTVTPGAIDPKTITVEKLAARLRCPKCGSPMENVSPWRPRH